MQAIQWQYTVANDSRAIGCYENIQIRNRWLDDSHCEPAVNLQAIGCESSVWLGHWMSYSILKTFTRATIMPETNASNVFDVEIFIADPEAWLLTPVLRGS